jgi:uncharacterized protein YjdB
MTSVHFKKPYLKNNHSADKIKPRAKFNGYKMNELASIYNFPKPTSSNYVAAVVSFGGGIYGNIDSNGVLTNSDCQAYWSYIGINKEDHPKVIVKTILGATNVPSDTDGGMTIENIIDVETLGGACPTSKLTIILYIAPNSSTFDSVFSYIYNSSYKPNIISCSWGMAEIYVDTAELNNTNSVFKQITDSGINICVATGDYGSNNGVSGKGNYVDFPASSPYVTALGGTTLTCPNYVYDSATKEIGWTRGGGGISIKFSKPAYQNALTAKGRSIPDISSCSDPKTGVLYIINGKEDIIGGTSVAAPTFAAYLAAINYKSFINPFLYSISNNCYNDVLTGSNGGYKASLGYDQCTGLGTINGTILKQALTNTNVFCTGLTVTPNTVKLALGKFVKLTITVFPDNATNKTVTYTSSNPTVVSVTSNGVLLGIKQGRTSVLVKTTDGSNLSYTVPITVINNIVNLQNVIVSPNNYNIKKGTTLKLTAYVTPYNATFREIIWSCSNKIITIDQTGLVTALIAGKATVYANSISNNKCVGTCTLTIL